MIIIFDTLHPPNRNWNTEGISLSFGFFPQYFFAARLARLSDIFPQPSLKKCLKTMIISSIQNDDPNNGYLIPKVMIIPFDVWNIYFLILVVPQDVLAFGWLHLLDVMSLALNTLLTLWIERNRYLTSLLNFGMKICLKQIFQRLLLFIFMEVVLKMTLLKKRES